MPEQQCTLAGIGLDERALTMAELKPGEVCFVCDAHHLHKMSADVIHRLMFEATIFKRAD